MNKSTLFLSFAVLLFLATGMVSALDAQCNIDVSLLNQDPIKAVPGEYVDVVFQLEGVDNAVCGTVTFDLIEEYPFSVDPSVSTTKVIQAGSYSSDFKSEATIPFSLRVDPTALDKTYEITVQYSTTKGGSNLAIKKDFNISVEDVTADFDIFVDDYVAATNTITFGILNVGKNDVEALTVEVPKQFTIDVKGSNKAIIGALDANQDTTFSYEATPKNGNLILVVNYNDENGERRSVERTVAYDSSYFTDRTRDAEKGRSPWIWVLLIVAILIVVYFVRRRMKKNKQHNR
jgi:hypothetical protein